MNRGQREYYKRDYDVAKAEGKPFFPYAVVKDLLIATLAIGLVIVLAIWQQVGVGEPVNPATTDYVPRPEWYFFFLFELLRIFKGQNDLTPVIMATFIIPNLMMALLILLPFYDRSPERRIWRRPIALITAAVTIFFLGQDPAAQAGADLFLANGCTSCHTVAGVGAPGPGPNLSNEGSMGHPPEFYEGFLKDPPGNIMPNFTGFTPEQYMQLGTFLSGLGTKYK